MVMSFFQYLSKELPDANRITASPSTRYNPTLVKSMFLWISVSMCHPSSSQISAPSLAPIDTSNWFFGVHAFPLWSYRIVLFACIIVSNAVTVMLWQQHYSKLQKSRRQYLQCNFHRMQKPIKKT